MSIAAERSNYYFYLYNMDETDFRTVYKRLNELTNINKEGMTIQQLQEHLQEIDRLKDLATKLLDDLHDQQKST